MLFREKVATILQTMVLNKKWIDLKDSQKIAEFICVRVCGLFNIETVIVFADFLVDWLISSLMLNSYMSQFRKNKTPSPSTYVWKFVGSSATGPKSFAFAGRFRSPRGCSLEPKSVAAGVP